MARQNDDSSAGLLAVWPWWLSLVAAGFAYLVLAYLVPALPLAGLVAKSPGALAKAAAFPVTLALLLAAPILYFTQRHRRRRLERRPGLTSVRSLSWQDFERLVAEAFRRQGFAVEERGGTAADGGIHLMLRHDAAVTLVQCKHWRERRVGVQPVRELYGAMTAEKASGALFITAGSFTAEATAFAESKPIGLIEGPALLELVQHVEAPQSKAERAPDPAPFCHVCSRPMVRRVGRTGFRRGEAFWRCTGYPHCKGTRQG